MEIPYLIYGWQLVLLSLVLVTAVAILVVLIIILISWLTSKLYKRCKYDEDEFSRYMTPPDRH